MGGTLLTFYLLLGGGFLLKTLKVFSQRDVAVFVNYIVYFALPITVFGVIHGFEIKPSHALIFLTAWLTVFFTYFSIYGVAKRLFDGRKAKTLFLTSAFGNTAFVGYPLVYSIYGDRGLAYAVLYDLLGNTVLVVSFAVFVISGKADWKTVYRFPPLGALILALLLKPLPLGFLSLFFKTVKASLTPTIVFALGLRLNPSGIRRDLKEALFAVFWRQIFIPSGVLLLLLLLRRFFEISPLEASVILLQSSTPPFVMSVVLSEKYRLETDLAVAAVNLGIFLLPFTASLWVFAASRLF